MKYAFIFEALVPRIYELGGKLPDDMKEFHDMSACPPAYIAYKGAVYGCTKSFLWKEGKRQVFHLAGTDLTEALADASHGEELMDRAPKIGILSSL